MPKRRRGDRSDNEVEIITFRMPEDTLDTSSSTISSAPTMTFPPPALPKQVFKVSEWTVETDRVSTSNTLFSSMTEPASSASFGESLHIPGVHHDYNDVVDVSDFQPPPEPLQPSASANTESSKSSKVRSFVSL